MQISRFVHRLGVALILTTSAPALAADVWYATHNLLPGDILQDGDVAARPPGRMTFEPVLATTEVIGQEVKRRVYMGHDLSTHDIGPRTVVKANTDVEVVWRSGRLSLELTGKALESGALGDDVRVLNTDTSRTIRGVVIGEQLVEVRSEP